MHESGGIPLRSSSSHKLEVIPWDDFRRTFMDNYFLVALQEQEKDGVSGIGARWYESD